ncbi:hypothetical protein L7F22_063394 [Adiantum nelumboides]|nr:hypothetical protein [Adiantum nelumboides]
MNQKELEAAVRKVSNDDSLDPRKKAYLMQHLMTSRWIVAQQRQPVLPEDGKEVTGFDPSFYSWEEKKNFFGCEHYKRNCKLLAACCGLLFTCRFCHDSVSDNTMDRQATKEMMCMNCLKIQPVAQHCITPSCNSFLMARYYCNICKFFDNDNMDIYHCPYCTICRVGKGLGIDFFHCMICNSCLNVPCRVGILCIRHVPRLSRIITTHTQYVASESEISVYFGMLDGLLVGEQLDSRVTQNIIILKDITKALKICSVMTKRAPIASVAK